MTENIFMSYSRRELGFVDQLVSRLEDVGYNVWLDYRMLIPGAPWDQQIDKGLKRSDTVLLVVSKASLASKYVTLEWRHFLETNKRVILLIFEAVDLPVELEKYEWVDFRGSYRRGMNELLSQLKQPVQEKHPVPETGFRAPFIVWVAVLLSVLVAILSLIPLWTVFIPWLLVPLPYKIFKRSFNFTQIQVALIALPFGISIGVALLGTDGRLANIISFFLAWALVFILRSKAMQRWGKPEANIPKYIKPSRLDIKNPQAIPFYVDHASEDRVVADDLANTLKKYGHPHAESIQSAGAVFVIVSRFKADTDADPDHQMVFPVMIQFNENISPKLQKIQWIDFRPGVRGVDAIAQLLPDPAELLKKLGMRPVSSQTVYFPVVTAMFYYLILLSVVMIGSMLDFMISVAVSSLLPSARTSTYLEIGALLLLFCGLTYLMTRGLTSRAGWFSSFRSLMAGVFGLGTLIFWHAIISVRVSELNINGVSNNNLGGAPVGVYFFGILIMGLVALLNRQDIRRWFPARK